MARDEAYREAEKKIEQARLSAATELSLSNPQWIDPKRPQLTELPESLGRLTQLRQLHLSSNQLITLPDWLGNLTQLENLSLGGNQLTTVPESLRQFTQLQLLDLSNNELTTLPDWLGNLTQLQNLTLGGNQLTTLPESMGQLSKLSLLHLNENQFAKSYAVSKKTFKLLASLPMLESLFISGNHLVDIQQEFDALFRILARSESLRALFLSRNQISLIPEEISLLRNLVNLSLDSNQLTDIPGPLAQLEHLTELDLADNPLNPELGAAYEQGLDAVRAYLRAKAAAQITLNEAKLILVGEGEVGKSCLMDALLGNPWQEHDSTHGIEIKQIKVTAPNSTTEITLNGWDFGGQRVYRPTHQLFFSAPAVYLVVWKPREGPQQGFVKEWIQLVKRREPDAKILVVATHGGPQQRQPDIDRQELWDQFGRQTLIDFFHVDNKPDEKTDERRGVDELKRVMAGVAASLPEMGRLVPKRWQDMREILVQIQAAYLPLERVLELCRAQQMDDEESRLFVTIEHRLGHLIHYEHDPALRDIVVLKPDWLATAISFVLDDEATRTAHGLVRFSRLSLLWNDPNRAADSRYPSDLHPIFLRLMERFDLSYRVADLSAKGEVDPQTLIAQLVPDTRPERDLEREWPSDVAAGDIQQIQICRIVDQKGQSATAEGLFFQLIVRLHKYSLGRVNYNDSVHWQRGLVLDDDYNGRALMEHAGNDVRISVRAPYPERFLAMLTSEVKYLVESFWEGLRCEVMVPCVNPCGRNQPGTGLFEVEKLIDSKRKSRPEYPCSVCNEWQEIDHLLRNAPVAQPIATAMLFAQFAEVKRELTKVRQLMANQGENIMGRFDSLDDRTRSILSRVDNAYAGLLQVLTDEAKEGPRLFSFVPVDRSNFNPQKWMKAKFRLTLWCERSRLPLPALNGKHDKKGVYEIELTRDWFKKAGPYLKLLTGTLSLVLPVASSGIKLALDDTAYKAIEEQLDFGKSVIDATIGEEAQVGDFMGPTDKTTLWERGEAVRARGANLRELHALLKAKDAGFGGLVRVMNKRQEFLWVHPQFEKEY